jgi:bifunctional DNA-binding transcriptional regulator/antitoxin component of YhaV-PrlF toxin-antitoxin module
MPNAYQNTPTDAAGRDPSFRITNAEIIQRGQVTVTKQIRAAHSLHRGDYIDMVVLHAGDRISIPDVRVGESGRVHLPARQRDRYNITVGDTVTIEGYV